MIYLVNWSRLVPRCIWYSNLAAIYYIVKLCISWTRLGAPLFRNPCKPHNFTHLIANRCFISIYLSLTYTHRHTYLYTKWKCHSLHLNQYPACPPCCLPFSIIIELVILTIESARFYNVCGQFQEYFETINTNYSY